MRLLRKRIPLDCEIALAGDEHIGTILSHEVGIQDNIDWVMADPERRFTIRMGDEIDAICTDDPRFMKEGGEIMTPMEQMEVVRDAFKPIKNNIFCWLWGNHSQKLHRVGNLTHKLCKELGVDYGTWTSKITFTDFDDNPLFKGYFCHGMRGTLRSQAKDYDQAQANLKASLKLKLREKAADCSIMACGHFHQLLIVEPAPKLYLTDDGKSVKQNYLTPGTLEKYIDPDRRWYACTGSFLKLFGEDMSGYAEIAGYNPVELGYIIMEVRDGKIAGLRKKVV